MSGNEEWYRFEGKERMRARARQAVAHRQLKQAGHGRRLLPAAAGAAVALGMALLAATWLFTAAAFVGVGFHSFSHLEMTNEH